MKYDSREGFRKLVKVQCSKCRNKVQYLHFYKKSCPVDYHGSMCSVRMVIVSSPDRVTMKSPSGTTATGPASMVTSCRLSGCTGGGALAGDNPV